MDFKRWEFSKQVQPELQKFLKLVQNNKKDTQMYGNKFWDQLLLKPTRSHDTDSLNVELNDSDVITIDDDDDDDIAKKTGELTLLSQKANITHLPDISIVNLSSYPSSQVPDIDLLNLKNSLKECLNNNRLLEEDDIKKISTELNNELISDLILYLNENVSDNGLLKLGESLNKFSMSNNEILRQYCKTILINKLLNIGTSITFMPVMEIFIKNYPEIVREELAQRLLNNHLTHSLVFDEVYKLLSPTEKDNLIRDFLFTCNELEDGHLLLLQSMLPQITEFLVKQRLINLLSVSADKFKDNKIYMKILIEIIKTLNKDYLELEPILYGIIEKNKTIFKISAEKALNAWFNSVN